MSDSWVNDGGIWKKSKDVWMNVGGVWKNGIMPNVNNTGVWKNSMSYIEYMYYRGNNIGNLSIAYKNGSVPFYVDVQNRESDLMCLARYGCQVSVTTPEGEYTDLTNVNTVRLKGKYLWFGKIRLVIGGTFVRETPSYTSMFTEKSLSSTEVNDYSMELDTSSLSGSYYIRVHTYSTNPEEYRYMTNYIEELELI